ncbi:MAG: hypothetical protein ABIG10_00320 [bacterium]
MSKQKISFLPIVIALIIVIAFLILKFKNIGQPEAETIPEPALTQDSVENIQNLVKDYLDNHISDLATEPEVLGGSFYITETVFLDNDRILVSYEDGHNAYTARVHYIIDHDQPLEIAEFNLLKKNNQLIETKEINFSPDDLIIVAIKQELGEKYNKDYDQVELIINQQDNNHLRGMVSFGPDTGDSGMFLAVMERNEWQVVFDKNGSFDCEELKQYEFSEQMLPECFE